MHQVSLVDELGIRWVGNWIAGASSVGHRAFVSYRLVTFYNRKKRTTGVCKGVLSRIFRAWHFPCFARSDS